MQGCAHDAPQTPIAGVYDRAYGWIFSGAGQACSAPRWGTVMVWQGSVDMNDCTGTDEVWVSRLGLLFTPGVT